MSNTPIAELALLSDCRSAALVDGDGSIEWWCIPRFDGASVFGRLLDQKAGHFSVRVVGQDRSRRRYLEGTLTVETTRSSEGGEVITTDALAMAEGARGHDIGKDSPGRLLRVVRCTSGRSRWRSTSFRGLSTD